MFLDYFRITGIAVAQNFILAAIGYFLVRKELLGKEGLGILSRLVIEVTLPILIFCQLVKDFSFSAYPYWWAFPLLSILITLAGLAVGGAFTVFLKGRHNRLQFLGLVAFQNSGYLPLALTAVLLSASQMNQMFIYIFLFLMGFNLIIFSAGAYILTFHENKQFDFSTLFSPPVVATLASLLFISLGLSRFMPDILIKPLKTFGDCTLPLAMLVVGGSLAELRLTHIDNKPIFLLILAKLVILPLLGLFAVLRLGLPQLVGLLIVMQLAMPPATFLSVIIKHYKEEDVLISQGILFGHIVSVFSIPLFLSLYFMLSVIK